jgi:hypothetical protein
VCSRRHRADLLPPRPRQLEALVRPWRDMLLVLHRVDLPLLLPSSVEHRVPDPVPVPPHLSPLCRLHIRAGMWSICPKCLYNGGSDGDFRSTTEFSVQFTFIIKRFTLFLEIQCG